MTDAEKVKQAYALLRSVNDEITRFFTVAWNVPPNNITAGDRMIVEQMRKNFCYEAVRDAFLESRAQKKESLAYVRTVAESLHTKYSVEKNLKEHSKIKQQDLEPYKNKNTEPDKWIGLLTKNFNITEITP